MERGLHIQLAKEIFEKQETDVMVVQGHLADHGTGQRKMETEMGQTVDQVDQKTYVNMRQFYIIRNI